MSLRPSEVSAERPSTLLSSGHAALSEADPPTESGVHISDGVVRMLGYPASARDDDRTDIIRQIRGGLATGTAAIVAQRTRSAVGPSGLPSQPDHSRVRCQRSERSLHIAHLRADPATPGESPTAATGGDCLAGRRGPGPPSHMVGFRPCVSSDSCENSSSISW
jgi:hypothetical protein